MQEEEGDAVRRVSAAGAIDVGLTIAGASDPQVAGIMLGMFSLGYVADQIGRKWGSCITAGLMFIGGILLTSASGSLAAWAWIFIIGEAVFGYAAPVVQLVSVYAGPLLSGSPFRLRTGTEKIICCVIVIIVPLV